MLNQGIVVPSITIFHENGSIDFENMAKHVENLIQGGVDGILLFGSTGEFYTISITEKKKLIKQIVDIVAHRTMVIIGINSCDLNEVVELGNYAKSVAADAVMAISPYYFAPKEQGILNFYSYVAEHVSDIPIFFYNFPDRSGNNLTAQTMLKLVNAYPNFVGAKDTVDGISHTRDIIQTVKKEHPDFLVFSGFDEYYSCNRFSGEAGTIGAIANFNPKLVVKMHRAYESGDFATFSLCSRKMEILMRIYAIGDMFMPAVKFATKIKTELPMSCYTKTPGVPLSKEQEKEIIAVLEEAENLQ